METYFGLVPTTADALVLFEAVRTGDLAPLTRRLCTRERATIRNGSVFVYDSAASGIKRVGDVVCGCAGVLASCPWSLDP
jgi:hypothetical protein